MWGATTELLLRRVPDAIGAANERLIARAAKRSRRFAREPEHRCHYLVERNPGVDDVPGASSQQRLDGLQKT